MVLAGMDRAKLQKLAGEARMAREGLKEIEAVALAFARWQGMTQETGIDRDAAKAEVDRLLDDIEPDAWDNMKDMIGQSRDDVLAELMVYSLGRAHGQVKAMVKDLEAEDEGSRKLREKEAEEDDGEVPIPPRDRQR